MKKMRLYSTKYGWVSKGWYPNSEMPVTVEGEIQRIAEITAVMAIPTRLNIIQMGWDFE